MTVRRPTQVWTHNTNQHSAALFSTTEIESTPACNDYMGYMEEIHGKISSPSLPSFLSLLLLAILDCVDSLDKCRRAGQAALEQEGVLNDIR